MAGSRLHPVGLALVASVGLAAGTASAATDEIEAPSRVRPATTSTYLHEKTLQLGLRPGDETNPARIAALRAFRLATAPRSQGDRRSIEALVAHQRSFAPGGGASTLPALEAWSERNATSPSEPTVTTVELLLRAGIDSAFASLAAGPAPCCICKTAADCSDGLFCNGAEVCGVGSACGSGAPPCLDGDACTDDFCFESTDTCAYDPVPPPAEVASVLVDRDAAMPTLATIRWAAVSEADSYNVYRGASVDLSDLDCFASGLPVTTQPDFDVPSDLYLYLVSSVACGESGLGAGTIAPRPAPPPCP